MRDTKPALGQTHGDEIRSTADRGRQSTPAPSSRSDGLASLSERDPHALERSYDLLGTDAYRLAFAVTRDMRLAEQVVESFFLDLWDRPERFDRGRGTHRSHLLALVLERALAASRSVESQDGDAPVPRGPLAPLPEVECTVVALVGFGRLTLDEVSDALGLNRQTISRRLTTALRRLAVPSAPASQGEHRER